VSSEDPRMPIAVATMLAMMIDDDANAAAVRLWAKCIVAACDAEGMVVPELVPYEANGTTWYGFQTGPWASQVDCGFGLRDGIPVIRVMDRRGDLHLWWPVAAVLRMFGLHRGDDYYFVIDGRNVSIWISKSEIQNYFGETGAAAITAAIRQALVYHA
jgi:hypothetical protein